LVFPSPPHTTQLRYLHRDITVPRHRKKIMVFSFFLHFSLSLSLFLSYSLYLSISPAFLEYLENQTINRIQCSSPWVKGSSVWKFFEAKDKFQNFTLLIFYCTLQTCSMCIIIFSKSYLFAFDTGKFVGIKHSTGKLDGFQYFFVEMISMTRIF
jgi:hypothetical protein